MNIKQAKQEIKNTIQAYLKKDSYGIYRIPSIRQRPILLIGPPGVGKTQIMEQVARECEIGLVSYTITHHTRQSAIGLPFISEKSYDGVSHSVTEYTMSEIVASLYNQMETMGVREGILFIDEINCVSETLAPAMLQFLQCKTFGNHRIPEGWIIVAAGNPPEYNKSVRDFDVVTLDRVREIIVEPEYKVWKEYAYAANIHPAVLSYLNARKDDFCVIEMTVDGRQFATPRGWEDLSVLLYAYEELGLSVNREVAYEYLRHPRIAKEFANYLELFYKYQQDYQIEEILKGRIQSQACERVSRAAFDEKLGIMSGLLARLNGQFRDIYVQEDFVERLMDVLKGCRREIDAASQENPQASGADAYWEALTRKGARIAAECERKKAGHLLSTDDERRSRRLSDTLNDYAQKLRAAIPDYEDQESQSWKLIQEWFAQERDVYDRLYEEGGNMLEYGFDFMEAAMGSGQEMVIFITELNTGFYSIRFLQQYSCERYYQYNKNLLFDQEEQMVKQAIARHLL